MDQKITQLPLATTVSDTDLFTKVDPTQPDASANLRITAEDLMAWIHAERAAAARYGSVFMADNAVLTTITTQNVFVKVAGTTQAGSVSQGFSASSNRLTLTGQGGVFALSTTLTVDNGAGTRFAFKYYIIRANGDPPFLCPQCKGTAQIPPGGAEITISIQSLLPLGTGDSVEVWVANETSSVDAVVKNLNMQAVSL